MDFLPSGKPADPGRVRVRVPRRMVRNPTIRGMNGSLFCWAENRSQIVFRFLRGCDKGRDNMNFLRALMALGINAVPALGWFLGDWTSGTTLVVYWFETVTGSLLVAARIVVQGRMEPRRGHVRYEPTESAKQNGARIPFVKHFLPVALMFSAAHGVFLAVLIAVMTANGRGVEMRLSVPEIALGCGVIVGFQMLDFVLDLFRMKGRPFRWVEHLAERNLGRVFVVHLVLIFGLLAGGLTGGARGFFAVFIGLKTLNDLSGIVPQYDPEEAPRWLCRLMDCVPNANAKNRDTRTFAEFWKAGKEEERERRARNERPVTG